jgi:hypothetical protein
LLRNEEGLGFHYLVFGQVHGGHDAEKDSEADHQQSHQASADRRSGWLELEVRLDSKDIDDMKQFSRVVQKAIACSLGASVGRARYMAVVFHVLYDPFVVFFFVGEGQNGGVGAQQLTAIAGLPESRQCLWMHFEHLGQTLLFLTDLLRVVYSLNALDLSFNPFHQDLPRNILRIASIWFILHLSALAASSNFLL